MTDTNLDFYGMPESWHCVDCGFDTVPGLTGRSDLEKAAAALGDAWRNDTAGISQYVDARSEVYTVRAAVWQKAGMAEDGGCLCIGCLETRLGRRLKPKDFLRNDPFNGDRVPGTARLLKRRGRAKGAGAAGRMLKYQVQARDAR